MRKLVVRLEEFEEPTFPSVDEAIQYASPLRRREKAEADTEVIRDARIVTGMFDDQNFEIKVSTGFLLSINVSVGRAEWFIGQPDAKRLSRTSSDEPVSLEMPASQEVPRRSVIWDRRKLLEARIGKSVKMLFASSAWLYLYVQSMPTLLFYSLRSDETGKEFLYWNETE